MDKITEVVIFGNRYKLKGDNPDKILKYSSFINQELEKVNNATRTLDEKVVYVLTSLEISKLYFEELEKNQILEKRIKNLKIKIDKSLNI